MKKVFLNCMLLLCALIVGSSSVWAAADYTYTLASGDFTTSSHSKESGGITWTVSNVSGTESYGWDATYGFKFGSGKSSYPSSFKLTSSSFSSNIKKIVVTAGVNSGKSCKLDVKVGSTTYGSQATIDTKDHDTWEFSIANASVVNGAVELAFSSNNGPLYLEKIEVFYYVAVTGVSLNKNSTSIEAGLTETLTPTIAPANATIKTVTWESNNTSVATVEGGVVTAVSEGVARITVTTTDGSYTATCDVTVTPSTSPFVIVSTTSLSFSSIPIKKNTSKTFTITPANLTTTLSISCDNAKYSVSPTSIASSVTTETTITVTANPTSLGDDMDGTITISGGGLSSNKSVTLSATMYNPAEITYDFSKIPDFSSWASGYNQHIVEYPEATVTFSAASKQTNTISDIPVIKEGTVTLVLKGSGDEFDYVNFECRQWTDKAKTISAQYSTNGGTSYSAFTPAVSSTTFSISKSDIPSGTNAMKLVLEGTNQVGIESITFGLNVPSTESVPISTGVGYATYASPHALDFTTPIAGLTPYLVSGIEGTTLTLTEVNTTIPAGTGLILAGSQANYTVPVVGYSNTNVSGNKLVGCTAATTLTANPDYYVLVNNGGAVFQSLEDNGATIPAKRAYLDLSGGSSAPSIIRIVDEENNATSINDIEASDKAVKFIENGRILILRDGITYDALGRKIR